MDLEYETNVENDIMYKPDDAVFIKAIDTKNVKEISAHLLEKKIVVLDFDRVQKEVARRVIDYLSGAVGILGGQVIKATDNMWVFEPC
ncbi:MAG: cell division protein SepF [Oscillospiraceae bacterium]|nr:cell division protein SepF [Oscillospiraceae bacterium]